MALIMETTKSIVSKEPKPNASIEDQYSEEREPFMHEQLRQVDNLSLESPKDVAGKDKLYDLAVDVGMMRVLRWKPRLVSTHGAFLAPVLFIPSPPC